MISLAAGSPWKALAVLVALAAPLILQGYPLYLATEAVILGLAAVGLDLLVGHLGLVSLGHAAFFGVGAYGAALLVGGEGPVGTTLLVPALAAGLLGALVAPLVLRGHGVFFLMLTLAVAQMLYAVAEQWVDVTRGADGISGIPKFGVDLGLGEPAAGYLWAVLLLGLTLWGKARLLASPFGRVLEAIEEREEKVRALGYPAFWYKLLAFVISGAITGLSGALYAHHTGYVSPHTLHWAMSGLILGMVIVGGKGTGGGPVLGAALCVFLQAWISSWTDLWQLCLGLLFIAAVRGSARGVWGLLERGEESGFRGTGLAS